MIGGFALVANPLIHALRGIVGLTAPVTSWLCASLLLESFFSFCVGLLASSRRLLLRRCPRINLNSELLTLGVIKNMAVELHARIDAILCLLGKGEKASALVLLAVIFECDETAIYKSFAAAFFIQEGDEVFLCKRKG